MRRFILAGCLVWLDVLSLKGSPPADIQSQLDNWTRGRVGGLAVAWVDSGGTSFFFSGKVDATKDELATPDTVFELGTLTQAFTGLLLAESERLGKISRDDAASKYLFLSGEHKLDVLRGITLLSLATHTSGLPRLPTIFPSVGRSGAGPFAYYDRAMLLDSFQALGPTAEVGRYFVVSEFGTSLLGEALAAAWHMSYAEALQEIVLKPLGMNSTFLALTDARLPAIAPRNGRNGTVSNWRFLAFAPAGALCSNVSDVSALLKEAISDSKTPLAASLATSLALQATDQTTGEQYALGWRLTGNQQSLTAWSAGVRDGSRCFIGINRNTRTSVAILGNIERDEKFLGFSLLGLPQPRDRKVANAADYVGRYQLPSHLEIEIYASMGMLSALSNGQQQVSFRLRAGDSFYVVEEPSEVTFERNRLGEVIALTLHHAGGDVRGFKQDPFRH